MLWEFGYKIMEQLTALQHDEDYAFESFPMPYNINLSVKNAGTMEVVYTVLPAPKPSELDKEVVELLDKKLSPAQVVEAMKEKQINKLAGKDVSGTKEGVDHYPTPEEEGIKLEDIPF